MQRPLGPGEVHVWRCDLLAAESSVARLRSWLSGDEAAREGRFRHERDRRRFAVAHGQLRDILGFHLGRHPAEVAFAAGPGGKPEAPPLLFSLSHSAELAVIAVSVGPDVGVDVERLRRVHDAEAAAAFGLSPAEQAVLGDAATPGDFLRSWTRREAYLKGRGEGISAGQEADDVQAREQWDVRDLDPAPGYVGALAVRCRAAEVRFWHWEPLA